MRGKPTSTFGILRAALPCVANQNGYIDIFSSWSVTIHIGALASGTHAPTVLTMADQPSERPVPERRPSAQRTRPPPDARPVGGRGGGRGPRGASGSPMRSRPGDRQSPPVPDGDTDAVAAPARAAPSRGERGLSSSKPRPGLVRRVASVDDAGSSQPLSTQPVILETHEDSEVDLLSRAAGRRLSIGTRKMSLGDVTGGQAPSPTARRTGSPANLAGSSAPSAEPGSARLRRSDEAGTEVDPHVASRLGDGEVEENINVGVRCRPIADHERRDGAVESVRIDRSSGQVLITEFNAGGDGETREEREEFKFNFAYPQGVETFEIYEEMVHPIISHLFGGFNGTVLCYGQTVRVVLLRRSRGV